MSQIIRFLAYSDIHHDRKAARCVTLQDTIAIENQVHARVNEGGFNFSVFAGDRFLKREPEDEIKVQADWALVMALRNRRVPHYHLVGNHDWTKNNREWHTSQSIKYIVPETTVLDQARTYHMGSVPWLIHALPADMPFDMANYHPDPSFFNLFIFHGIVRGSLMVDDNDRVFEDGISISDIDRPEWDFVVGGDIHVPQKIPFKNTVGGYVGSVVQRTRMDSDKPRGWLEVTATRSGEKWEIKTEFATTRNFFHREIWQVGPETQYEDIRIDERYTSDMALEVRLVGDRADVDRVADDPRWSNYSEILLARSLDVIRDYKVAQKEAVVDLSQSVSVSDDLKLYLASGFANIGNISEDKIFEMVQKMMEGRNV